MKRLLICFFLAIYGVELNANSDSVKSIQWQRIDLETNMRERISEFLGLILDKNKFYVEVQISATSPNLTVPKFDMPKSEKKKVVQGVKFTDEKNDKSRNNAEYILFDKIGILSPLFETEGAQSENDRELQIKFFQYQEKLERELISKNDLFGLINSIDVTIAFDNKLDDKKVDEIKKLVEKVIPKVGDLIASIEVFKMDFFEEVKDTTVAGLDKNTGEKIGENDLKEESKEITDLIKENIPYLTGPIGTIVATFLFCLSAFILFAGLKKHQQALAQSAGPTLGGEESDSTSDKTSNDDHIDPDFRPGSPQLIEAISTEKEGVKKLFLYLEKSNNQACNLIKKWINLDSSLSNATLLVLSERMSIDELYSVFDKLTAEERENWIKVSSSNEITPDLKQQADGFIAQQVMEDIMTVSATEDAELQKLLVELSPSKAAEISKKNTEHGAVLVNLMSSNFLAQMYLLLDAEEISDISMKGLKLTDDIIKEKINELKEILKDSVIQKYTNPFSRRFVEIINDLDPIRQEKMISALIEEKQVFIVKDIVKKIIPISVIEDLPQDIAKDVFKGISKDLRLDYLISLEDETRQTYINLVSQEGTKGREVLDFEINKALEDEVSVARIQKKSEEIKKEYIIQARNTLKSDELLYAQVMDIVDDWLIKIDENGTSEAREQEAA